MTGKQCRDPTSHSCEYLSCRQLFYPWSPLIPLALGFLGDPLTFEDDATFLVLLVGFVCEILQRLKGHDKWRSGSQKSNNEMA